MTACLSSKKREVGKIKRHNKLKREKNDGKINVRVAAGDHVPQGPCTARRHETEQKYNKSEELAENDQGRRAISQKKKRDGVGGTNHICLPDAAENR